MTDKLALKFVQGDVALATKSLPSVPAVGSQDVLPDTTQVALP